MRTRTLACLVSLWTLAAPSLAAADEPDPRPAAVERAPGSRPQPLTEDELEQYAARERAARKQEKFQGGRMRHTELITIILVLVIIILVLAII